ncbi:MAG: hypothetical protein AAB400_02060 [Patescibacteria group bacterium]
MKRIAILGAGELGSCIGKLLQKNKKLSIEWWDANPQKVPNQKPLATLVSCTDFLFLCVPSWVFRKALEQVRPHLKKTTIVVSFAKGIERKTQLTMDVLLNEVLHRNQPTVLVSGPMLAEELEMNLPAGGILAAKNRRAYERVAALFAHTPITCCYSSDVRGVALAGVLKNIYATALGAVDGLGLGMNARGLVIVRAADEMARILPLLGGKAATTYSLAGIGDLIATGSSNYSKNYSVGKELALSGVCGIESEGKSSIAAFESMLGGKAATFKLFQVVKAILSCKKDARSALSRYFKKCE